MDIEHIDRFLAGSPLASAASRALCPLLFNQLSNHVKLSKNILGHHHHGPRPRCRVAFTLLTMSSIVRSKVHAALTPSPAYSGLNKENGMGKEWGRGRGVSGRQEGRGAQPCRR
eukprot:scaffold4160_cov130-Isochrysis_galbana.AAC.7